MINSTIDRNRFNETGKKLYDLLVPLVPHEDYIYYIMSLAIGDKNRQIVIDYIENVSNKWYDIVDFVDSKW